MSAVTAFARTYPRERLALINGLIFTSGGMGAITATAPIEAALGFTDWRGVFFALAAVTALAAATIYLVVPKDPAPDRGAENPGLSAQICEIRAILKHPAFIQFVPFAVLTQSANLSMPTLWAGPWLGDVAGLARADVASTLMWIAVGLMAGFFTWGVVAERLARYGIDTVVTMVTVSIVYMTVQLFIILGLFDAPRALWVLFSFTGTIGSLAYAAVSQRFPTRLAGRVNTVLNLFVFLGAFAAQWGIGAIVNLWPHTETGHFAQDGYTAAFTTMLALEACGLAWLCVTRAFKLPRTRDIAPAS
jgi:predicted MFS family arabinose efflux permease